MSGLDRWLAREAARERRRPVLEECLIGGRAGRYVLHRLRLVAGARLLGYAVHVVEFLFLLRVFTDEGLGLSFAARNFVLLAGASWWGALEVLRTRIRREDPNPADRVEVERWLTLSLIAAVGLLAVTGVGLGAAWLRSGRPPGILELYFGITFARLSVDLVARTLYSGIYARRRVYRPALWILGLEMLGLASALLFWGVLGLWAFPVALAISTAASRAATVHFTARAYRMLRIPVPRWTRLRRPRLTSSDLGAMAVAGASNAATRLGSVLVLFLVLRGVRGAEALLQWLHVLAPLLATAGSWAQVFYPDFKRLEDRAAGALRRRLERALARSSFVVGTALGALAVGTSLGLTGRVHPEVLATGPLLVVQSYVGQLHLRFFAQDRFRRLLAGGLALTLGIPLLGLAIPGEGQAPPAVSLVLGTAAAIALSGVVMRAWPFADGRRQPHGEGIWAWLESLAANPGPVRIGRVTMGDSRAFERAAVLARIEECLELAGKAVERGRTILWFETGDRPVMNPDQVLVWGAGLIDDVCVSDPQPSGREAARSEEGGRRIGRPREGSVEPIPALVARLRAACPGGLVVDLESGTCDRAVRDLSPRERQDVWRRARLDALGKRVRTPDSPFEVRSVVDGGEIRLLFLVPRKLDAAQRRLWAETVRSGNWVRAVA
jgi:hypothetical protein